jgi:hypothetical protein
LNRIDKPRPIAAILIGALALTLVGALPEPITGASCSCCDSGLCLLGAGGCDHRQQETRAQASSCCVTAAGPSGTVPVTGPSELEAAVLPLLSTPAVVLPVTRCSQPGLLVPAPPPLRPESPPPRLPSSPIG